MAGFASIRLRPGVNVEQTATLNEATYQTVNFGRFRAGLFEKLGGWVAFNSSVTGTPRAVTAWQDFSATARLAYGTTTGLYVVDSTGVTTTTISPQTLTTNGAVQFTTSNGSNVFVASDPNATAITKYDMVEFLTPVSIGGMVISGSCVISASFPATTSYTASNTLADATASVGPTSGTVPSFATTAGGAVVSVTLASHGLAVGDTINFAMSTSVGGLTISGTYTVNSVTSSSVFTIVASSTASSSTSASMNGGSVRLRYSIGLQPGTGQTTGTAVAPTDWTLDNWGETLLACPANGAIYAWTPSQGTTTALPISGATAINSGMFVTAPVPILMAYGVGVYKTIGLAQDPLFYAWSDLADYTFWGVNQTNPSTGDASQAGFNRIPTGSRIVAGLATVQAPLLWTDIDLWAINYVGPPFVFSQIKIGSNCGAISRHAVAQMNGVVYWMGRSNFFALVGSAEQPIPCTVWDIVFQDLDTTNLDKCWIETVTAFNEVWFFYPSASGATGQCDKYAKLNIMEHTWDYGALPRSAGIDTSVVSKYPIMAGVSDASLWTHENGYNAGGAALSPTFTTGYFMIGEGEDFVVVDQILPDFKYNTASGQYTAATISITFSVIDYQGDTPRTFGPYAMTAATNKLDVRFRGRQMQITMSSSDLNSFWRLGRLRYRWAPAGRR